MSAIFPSGLRTRQRHVHPKLEAVVRRHLETTWQGGAHAPTAAAFAALVDLIGDDAGRGLVLDSGCGTGESTRRIAGAHPGHLVIGVDRSEARLARLRAPGLPHREGNAIWVRAELAAFWRLALEQGWRLERHYLLYPNPWPKASHLRRRWHAHPAFTALLGLGGRFELRTNWKLYAHEFALAVQIATGLDAVVEPIGECAITSPFERKYRARGEDLYRVGVDLAIRQPRPEPAPTGVRRTRQVRPARG